MNIKEDYPIPDKIAQAWKEIEEGTVNEEAWSLAKSAGINEHDIEIHYSYIRVNQLNAEESKNRLGYKLGRKVRANRKLILVCLVVLILIAASADAVSMLLVFGRASPRDLSPPSPSDLQWGPGLFETPKSLKLHFWTIFVQELLWEIL